jgi:CDP-glucose 4,6-dehydratase
MLNGNFGNKMFKGIYYNKRIFITGHTGFKGSWLLYWLRKLNSTVCGFSDTVPTSPAHYELIEKENFIDLRGDINNYENLKRELINFNPELIFHLAAQPLVRLSYQQPVETFMTNVMGTVHILDIAKDLPNLKGIVVITSDKCYENFEDNRAYTEDDRYGGHDPYSASKGAAEVAIQSFRKSFYKTSNPEKILSSVRAGNVIGGGDWSDDRLIPDLVKNAASYKTTIIRNPDAERPWQHVLEPLSGYLLIGQKILEGDLQMSDNWNFGPLNNDSLSVRSVYEISKKIWPDIYAEFPEQKNKLHEAKFLRLNSDKAKTLLKWHPVWSMEKAIEKTIKWYKEFYNNNKINTAKDLEEYIYDAQNLSLIWTK